MGEQKSHRFSRYASADSPGKCVDDKTKENVIKKGLKEKEEDEKGVVKALKRVDSEVTRTKPTL